MFINCSVSRSCKNQIVVKNLRIVAQWWTLSEGHLLRLYLGVLQPSVVWRFLLFNEITNILLYRNEILTKSRTLFIHCVHFDKVKSPTLWNMKWSFQLNTLMISFSSWKENTYNQGTVRWLQKSSLKKPGWNQSCFPTWLIVEPVRPPPDHWFRPLWCTLGGQT